MIKWSGATPDHLLIRVECWRGLVGAKQFNERFFCSDWNGELGYCSKECVWERINKKSTVFLDLFSKNIKNEQTPYIRVLGGSAYAKSFSAWYLTVLIRRTFISWNPDLPPRRSPTIFFMMRALIGRFPRAARQLYRTRICCPRVADNPFTMIDTSSGIFRKSAQ